VRFSEAARPILLRAKKVLRKIGIKTSEEIWANGLEILLKQQGGLSSGRSRKSLRLHKNALKVAPIGNSTVVWAKIKGFPYYPARIIKLGKSRAPDSRAIPKEILENAKLKTGDYFLVKFFDANGAYALVRGNSIKPLGEDFGDDFSTIVQEKNAVVKSTKQDLFRAFQEAKNWSTTQMRYD